MADLDPARILIVKAIATMENAIEALIIAQAPQSKKAEIEIGIHTLKQTSARLLETTRRIEVELADK